MKCKGCNAELENTDKLYCEKCSLRRKKARRILNIVLPVVFLALLGLGIKLAFFKVGPDKIINEFLSALKSRDYKTAYSLFDAEKLKANQLLTQPDFEACFRDSEVQDYKITVKNTKYNASQEIVEYDVSIKQGNERRNIKIEVLKTLVDNKTTWRVDPLSFTTKTSITTLGELTVKVNGQDLPLREKGDYNLSTFKNTPLYLILTHKDITQLEARGKSGESFTLLNAEPSASIKNAASETVKGFKEAWFKTIKDYNLSYIETFVAHGSSKWETITGYIDFIKTNKQVHNESLLGLKIMSVEFRKDLGKYSLDKILVTTEENTLEANGVQKTTNWIYELEKQQDSNWLITNYYIKD